MVHYYHPSGAEIVGSERSALSRLQGILPISCSKVGALLAAGDFSLIIGLALLIENFLRPIATTHFGASHSSGLICALSAVLYCLFMEVQDQYVSSKWRRGLRAPLRAATSWLAVFLTLSSLVFFAKAGSEISRATIGCLFGSGLVVLPTWRFLALKIVSWMLDKHMFAVCERVVVVSVAKGSVGLDARQRHDMRRQGRSVVAQLSVESFDIDAIERLKCVLAGQRIDQIWFSCPMDTATITQAAAALKAFPLPVFWLADQTYRQLHALPTESLGSVRALKVQGGPLTKAQQTIKRMLDVVMASAGLLLLSPLFLLVAVAIKLDSRGPVIFSQRRSGFNGQTFRIHKFRSMTSADDGADIVQATRNDGRITRVGRVLRRSSLDELPQLLNVIKGDMSVVGPRPHALCHDTQYSKLIETYALRYHVKPGITGWAQSKGCRGETRTLADMEHRVDLDIWYIKNWSFLTDVKAIIGTLKQLTGSPNAY